MLELEILKKLAHSCVASPLDADKLVLNHFQSNDSELILYDIWDLLTRSLSFYISISLSKKNEMIAQGLSFNSIEAINTEISALYDTAAELFSVLPLSCYTDYLNRIDLSQMSLSLSSPKIWETFFRYHNLNDADILYSCLIAPNFSSPIKILPAIIEGLLSSHLSPPQIEEFFLSHLESNIHMLSNESMISLLNNSFITEQLTVSQFLISSFIRNNISNHDSLYDELRQIIHAKKIDLAVLFIEKLTNEYLQQLSNEHCNSIREILHALIVRSRFNDYDSYEPDNTIFLIEPIIIKIFECKRISDFIIEPPMLFQLYCSDCVSQVFSWACHNNKPRVLDILFKRLKECDNLKSHILSKSLPQYKITENLTNILTTPSLTQYSDIILEVFQEMFARHSIIKYLYISYEEILKNQPRVAHNIRKFLYEQNFKGLDYLIQNQNILSEKTLLDLFEIYDNKNQQQKNSLLNELSKKATHLTNTRCKLIHLGADLVSTSDMQIALILNLLFSAEELNELFSSEIYSDLAKIYQQGQTCLITKHIMHYKSAPLRILQDWMEQKDIIHQYPTVRCEKLTIFREPYDHLIRARQETIFAKQSCNRALSQTQQENASHNNQIRIPSKFQP